MNQQITQLPGLVATVTAHKDDSKTLLLVTAQASEAPDSTPRTSVKTALVIDRSGSMAGKKLEITRSSAAQFVRSLSDDDQVGVVVYDDTVDMISGMTSPSDSLAKQIERIESGGSTNLYGGWLMGAKLVGQGGRVILLSDGQANGGRYQDAESLSEQARISYQRFGVTTTTIGVGRDYDEGLMAGMARLGGGAHYFADTSQSILDAFSHERYAIDAMVLESVSVRCGTATEQFGHFWSEESKSRVFAISSLDNLAITLRYRERATGITRTEPLALPREFGFSQEATLEDLLIQASQAESQMLDVRDPRSAARMKDMVRSIVIELLSHSASDTPAVKTVIERLKASIERLSQLEQHYSEDEAMLHRKRSMQSSHNLMERGKAFSAFEDETSYVREAAAMAAPSSVRREPIVVDEPALNFATRQDWERWKVVPLAHTARTITIAMENPRDGFLIAEIQKVTGRKVKPVFADSDGEALVDLLKQFR